MIPFIAVVLMVALDQWVKHWAVTVLQPMQTLPLWHDVFQLTYVENRGAAFSLFQNQRIWFILLTVLAVGACLYALFTKKVHSKLGKWAIYCILGGAIGNGIDRVVHGYVVDLFDFRLIHFPVFNVADIFVCVGGALLMFVLFRMPEGEQNDG